MAAPRCSALATAVAATAATAATAAVASPTQTAQPRNSLAAQEGPALPPAKSLALSQEAASAAKAEAKGGIYLRNELLRVACHVGGEALIPEILRFARSHPSHAEMEEKLRGLKRLLRSSGDSSTGSRPDPTRDARTGMTAKA